MLLAEGVGSSANVLFFPVLMSSFDLFQTLSTSSLVCWRATPKEGEKTKRETVPPLPPYNHGYSKASVTHDSRRCLVWPPNTTNTPICGKHVRNALDTPATEDRLK